MKWFKNPKDLYELLVLEDLYFGNTGSFARRVPGGWIFYHYAPGAAHYQGTFVPMSDEFKHLADEEFQSMAHPDIATPEADQTET